MQESAYTLPPETHTINLTGDELPLVGAMLELDNFMDIPIVEARISEDMVRMFVDTGAKLSYLDPDITNKVRYSFASLSISNLIR